MGDTLKQAAVLTGDVIGSSKLKADQLEGVLKTLSDAAHEFDAIYQSGLIGTMAVFRGDSWQLAITDTVHALRLAVYLRAIAIGHDVTETRVAVAVGPVDMISTEAISRSSGPAFARSGAALDGLGDKRLAYDNVNDATLAQTGQLICPLLDTIITQWTAKQAYAAAHLLLQPELSDAALVELLGTGTRRNFTKLRKRAHANAIQTALQSFEGLH